MLNFKFDWILLNELSIGPVPRKNSDLLSLKSANIKSIFSLIDLNESIISDNELTGFTFKRLVLPDHKWNRGPYMNELIKALEILDDLLLRGPVFIHCYAAVERSPMVCIAWLMKNKRLSFDQSLDYVMSVHSGTSPIPLQIKLLRDYESKFM